MEKEGRERKKGEGRSRGGRKEKDNPCTPTSVMNSLNSVHI